MDFFEILKAISLPNRDDGSKFTDTRRIEKIEALLWNSGYRRINPQGLFFLYARKPLEEITNPVLISSHIDCVSQMSTLFSRDCGDGMILGTYDNCITNAAVVQLMLDKQLPDNVLIAFTGDEEREARGAAQLVAFLSARKKIPCATIILDVTDMGWEEKAMFTVENNFWKDSVGSQIVACAEETGVNWRFVPSDEEDIPKYVNPARVIPEEAECDESWEYDEYCWPCFSLCIPIHGPMHSSKGVLARKESCRVYADTLARMAASLTASTWF